MAPAKEFIDYYAVLKVSQTDSFETIKSSYRVLALQLHPDKNPGDPAATQAFQKVGCPFTDVDAFIGLTLLFS